MQIPGRESPFLSIRRRSTHINGHDVVRRATRDTRHATRDNKEHPRALLVHAIAKNVLRSRVWRVCLLRAVLRWAWQYVCVCGGILASHTVGGADWQQAHIFVPAFHRARCSDGFGKMTTTAADDD